MALKMQNLVEERFDSNNMTLELFRHMLPANVTPLLEELNISLNDLLQTENFGEILNSITIPEEPPDKNVSMVEKTKEEIESLDKFKALLKIVTLKSYLESEEVQSLNFTNHNRTLSMLYQLLAQNKSDNGSFTTAHMIPRVDFTKINLVLPTVATKPQVFICYHQFILLSGDRIEKVFVWSTSFKY